MALITTPVVFGAIAGAIALRGRPDSGSLPNCGSPVACQVVASNAARQHVLVPEPSDLALHFTNGDVLVLSGHFSGLNLYYDMPAAGPASSLLFGVHPGDQPCLSDEVTALAPTDQPFCYDVRQCSALATWTSAGLYYSVAIAGRGCSLRWERELPSTVRTIVASMH